MDKPEQHDIDGLLRKNAELLGELKTAKARITELEAERDGARAEAEEAAAAFRRVKLDEPLEAAIGQAFVLPWRMLRPVFDEHFDAALDDEGAPQITARATGEAVPMDALLREVQTIPDLAAALRPVSGPDVRGGGHRHLRDLDAPPAPKQPAPRFGLR